MISYIKSLITALSLALTLTAFGLEVDTTFNVNNTANINRFSSGENILEPQEITIGEDGKIYVLDSDITSHRLLERYNKYGDREDDYNVSGFTINGVQTGILDNQNRLILSGSFYVPNGSGGNDSKKMVRILNDGSIDTSYHPGNFTRIIETFIKLPDSSIIGYGEYTNPGSVTGVDVVKFKADGTFDSTFISGLQNPFRYGLAKHQKNGKILVGGAKVDDEVLVRLNADGSLDSSFQFDATSFNQISDVTVLSNGDFLVNAGQQGTVKYKQDGSIDASFTPIPTYQLGVQTKALPNGEILCYAGSQYDLSSLIGSSEQHVYKMDENGNIIQSFANGKIGDFWNVRITHIRITNQNEIILAGDFTHYNDRFCLGLIKIDFNGNVIDDYRVDFGLGYGQGLLLYPQDDASTFLIQDGNLYDGHYTGHLLKLDSQGVLDQSFYADAEHINDVGIFQDGSMVIVGDFLTVGGVPAPGIAKVNQNGSRMAFPSLSSILKDPQNPKVDFVFIQDDQKIVIAGEFVADVNGQNMKCLVRLNSDGSIDPTFVHQFETLIDYQFGNYRGIIRMKQAKSGALLLFGNEATHNGNNVGGVLVVNQDGSLRSQIPILSYGDNVFDVNDKNEVFTGSKKYDLDANELTGFDASQFISDNYNYTPNEIIALDDGGIILHGSKYNEFSHINMVRLDSTGQLDGSFNSSQLAISIATRHMALNKSNQLLIAGWFSTVDGRKKEGIVRLNTGIVVSDSCALKVTFKAANFNCQTVKDSVIAVISGATGITFFQWEGVNSVDSLALIDSTGNYKCIVTDQGGCVDSSTIWRRVPSGNVLTDMEPFLTSIAFRPGRKAVLDVFIKNHGCLPSEGKIYLVLDSSLTYVSATVPPSMINSDTLFWDYSAISFSSNAMFTEVTTIVDTAVTSGTPINILLGINPSILDSDTSNNVKSFTFEIVNSYDPNDITVHPSGECLENYTEVGEKFTYTVRFQNTGTAAAIDIAIKDSIDSNLNIESLNVIYSSHPMTTSIYDGNIVHFNFSQIWLLDSVTNEPLSHGKVIFTIDQKENVVLNTVINNRVGIYFDFNPVVLTNEVKNTIVDKNFVPPCRVIASATITEIDEVLIYPNPVTEDLNVINSKGNGFRVYDVTGKLLFTSNQNSVNIQHLPDGHYFIKSLPGRFLGKFIKL
ncbi:MAG: putative delta-60 repeat protein/putative repeat protein (TIGR01451 family) [Saprospiraceae bacterium]|jgi:uncharacterized delta-60 repeat protein/uncharacterized repeat protein (TIGR01451 family)